MRVVPLLTGRVRIHRRQLRPRGIGPARLVVTLLDRQWTEWLPVWCWAIEHPEGPIVVDGGAPVGWTAPWWDAASRLLLRFDVRPEDDLRSRLRENGIDPADVRVHVATHLHVDHVGALGTLPSAEVVLSEREWRAARGRLGRVLGLMAPASSSRLRAVALAAAGHRLTPDGAVVLLPTPGHSPGHLSVLVHRGDEQVLIAGDAVYDETQLRDGRIDGVALDASAARDTVRRLQELCRVAPTVVLPSHDPAAADRLAARRITAGAFA